MPDSSKWPDLCSIGVGLAVEEWCRGDVGGQAPSILTSTPRLGIGWFVASHGWIASQGRVSL